MKLTSRVRSAVTTFVLFGAITATGSAQIQRVTIAGINNFWRVDDTISTGGTITAREMAIALRAATPLRPLTAGCAALRPRRSLRTCCALYFTARNAERRLIQLLLDQQ